MQKFRKLIALAVVAVLSLFVFGACSENSINDISANLTSYTIDAVLNDEAKTLDVTQKVSYHNGYDIELTELYFHLYPNAYREGARFSPFTSDEIAEAYPSGLSYGGIEISKVKVGGKDAAINVAGQDEDILIVPLSSELMPSQRVEIELSYKLNIPSVRHRFGYYNKTVNLGNFYPVACVYEEGAFEASPYYSNGDPFYSDIANYTVSVTAPKKYTAAMSGKTETPVGVSAQNNKTTASIKAARDFAVVLGEFTTKTASADGVDITYYYYADDEAAASVNIAADCIKTFNGMFGKYPYESYSVVQTHFLAGGMEYPGLVYISDRQQGELYRDVIAHETAHQWWYGIVGNNQISHAWLDETLAEYSATLFYQANPTYNVSYSLRIADALRAYAVYCDMFSAGLDTSMTRKLPDYRTSLEYTFMTYTKGQIMMDSLRKTIGDEYFLAGLKKYCTDNYLKVAKPENLMAAFESACKRDLEGFFNTWLDGNVLTFGKS